MVRKPRPKLQNPHEWVNLITVSGPFPGDQLLRKFWPTGLDLSQEEQQKAATLAQVYEAWLTQQRDPEHHQAWFRFMFTDILDLQRPEIWVDLAHLDPAWRMELPGQTYKPSAAITNPDDAKPRLFLRTYPPQQQLDALAQGYDLTPLELMRNFCLQQAVPLGLVTNGEEWVLVHAYADQPTTYATFTARDWLEERETLRAFLALLDRYRFFAVEDSFTLEALFQETLHDAAEVTDTLGRQVREAVEILVRTFDTMDLESGRQWLKPVPPETIYEAALTVMMRLVVVFCAEDRGLFPRDANAFYSQNYALSNLRHTLRAHADQDLEEVLERHADAWCRLLACFRMIYAGVHHETLQMPAYGSSLFDPERFPFLEGREKGQALTETRPPRVDNRTVLHLLEALQVLRLKGDHTRLLDFQTLGPEEVGHVYEGLLDHTARRATEPVLGLQGTVKKGQDLEPELALSQLEAETEKGPDALVEFLSKTTGRSAKALVKDLTRTPEGHLLEKLRSACGNDEALFHRCKPFATLLRMDSRGTPFVVTPGGVYVTQGTDRRNSGTHYTPRSLSEEMVKHTLDPLVYVGPEKGLPESKWELAAPETILGLKLCDPAMGSGAFLVQACRYLSAKLVEAWSQREPLAEDTPIQPHAARGALTEAPLGNTPEERLAHARRLICTRCLYGVDKNPMAVEMAKLSLWLITLDASKPFTFLGHHLAHGDSLLGVADLNQLLNFHTDPLQGRAVHNLTGSVREIAEAKLKQILALRNDIEADVAATIVEVNRQERLTAEAEALSGDLKRIADLLMGAALASNGKTAQFDEQLTTLAYYVEEFSKTDSASEQHRQLDAHLAAEARRLLGTEPLTGQAREPFHWVLAFPEVFLSQRGGFSAIVGNPPFLGGKKISGPYGTDYREYLVQHLAGGTKGHADLCAYFYLRAYQLLQQGGIFGFIATNSLAQGDTREVGLARLEAGGCQIVRATPSRKWPGVANLEVAQTWIRLGSWPGKVFLNDSAVKGITSYLAIPGKIQGKPERLSANANLSFQGSVVLGMGFVLTPEEAQALIAKDAKNQDVLFPYLNGEDLNSQPDQSPSRWVINFFDWPLSRETAPDSYQGPVATDYPDCLRIVETLVKPERDKLGLRPNATAKGRAKLWWHYGRRSSALYEAIAGLELVIATAQTSRRWAPCSIKNNSVFSHTLVLFSIAGMGNYAVLQSTFHEDWRLLYGPSLRNDARYTPSDCFLTFPFPEDLSGLEEIGAAYHAHRQAVMAQTGLGLTKTYNRFHDPRDLQADIAQLRRLHRDLDLAAAKSYGWDDLDLGHGFHTTTQGLRYTLAPHVIDEILDRLLALNHRRYAAEVEAGLHTKKKPKGKPIKAKKAPQNQLNLF